MPASGTKRCPYCHLFFWPSQLDDHIRTAHPDKAV